MKVLGISPLDKDSTVTIVEDGRITYAAAEERFTRNTSSKNNTWSPNILIRIYIVYYKDRS